MEQNYVGFPYYVIFTAVYPQFNDTSKFDVFTQF